MEIRVLSGDIAQQPVDAIIVNLFEGVTEPGGATGAVDRALNGALRQLIAEGEIKGKASEMTLVHTFGRIPAKRVIVAGLGKAERFDLDRVRSVTAESLKFARQKGFKTVATIVHGAGIGGLDLRDAAQALAEGALLGLYRFRRHKTGEQDANELQELRIVEFHAERVQSIEEGVRVGRILAESTNFARDLINEPPNLMTPVAMADAAARMAQEVGLECEVLDRVQMAELGMGALLGVAAGSHNEPRLIVLRYKGDGAGKPKLALLGKGITFDTGGINLKSSEGMRTMKGDMAGGAAVLGAMRAIALLRPALEVTGIVPAVENMPGGGAQRPEDVVRTMSGKTVEITNTDAEGRLVLADAMAYAKAQGHNMLIDVATLTGAARTALGPKFAAGFARQRELLDQVIAAGEREGEPIWPMPLTEEYTELMRSEVADLKNAASDPAGGAITAAAFLAEFAGDTPWVHLDIAPVSFADRETAYHPRGARGVMVRTLATFAMRLAAS